MTPTPETPDAATAAPEKSTREQIEKVPPLVFVIGGAMLIGVVWGAGEALLKALGLL
jgi:hypothetical protein